MTYALGIDLGTTYSAAAIAEDDRAEILQLGSRSATVPSVVFLREDDELLTGDAAERRAASEPARGAREFKRRLGDPAPLILGGTPFGAEALMAGLLRTILAHATEERGEAPATVAVTHPANYGTYKLDLLRQMTRQAGLENVVFLEEPVAAALHYALQERIPAGTIIAVYDFGGGTFDAAVLRKTEDGFESLGQAEGLERLGGIDFDEAVFAHVVDTVGRETIAGDRSAGMRSGLTRLREDCRLAKEALSDDTEATISVLLPGNQSEVRLTRAQFEDVIRPRIRETVSALERSVRSAGLEMNSIDRILLVGGCSRIPLIGQTVRELTGRPVSRDSHPKHAIALGAALYAARVSSAPELLEEAPSAQDEAAGPVTLVSTIDAAAIEAPATARASTNHDPPTIVEARDDVSTTLSQHAPAETTSHLEALPVSPPTAAEPVDAFVTPVPEAAPYRSNETTTRSTAGSRRSLLAMSAGFAAVAGVVVGLFLLFGSEGGRRGDDGVSTPSAAAAPLAALPSETLATSTEALLFMTDRDGHDEIYVMNTDGSSQTRLTYSDQPNRLPDALADGSRVAFVSGRDGGSELYLMNGDGTDQTRIPTTDGVMLEPSLSPDGKRIVFEILRGDVFDLYLINSDGSGLVNLTDSASADIDPAWSPDGQRIVFASDREGDMDIYVMQSDGSGVRRFVSSGFDAEPEWSPDGKRIVFQSNRSGDSDLYIIDDDGSGLLRLTSDPRDEFAPVWSIDGTRIAYTLLADATAEVYVVNVDGTDPRSVSNHPSNDSKPAWTSVRRP